MNYTPDMISSAMKMLLALLVVLGGLGLVLYFMKRFLQKDAGSSMDKPVRVLANTYLGVKKSISLVDIPGAVLVLGITNDKISLLSKIEDKEVLKELKGTQNIVKASLFSDQLHKISSKFKGHKNSRS